MIEDINDKFIGNRLDRWFVEGLHSTDLAACPYNAETLAEKWWRRGCNHAVRLAERDRLKALNALLAGAIDALIDVWDDQETDPDYRCYVEGAWKSVLNDAREVLADHKAALAASQPQGDEK